MKCQGSNYFNYSEDKTIIAIIVPFEKIAISLIKTENSALVCIEFSF